MTKTMDWLQAKAPEFNRLTQEERDEIADFSLLWSMFEGLLLNSHGNAANISKLVQAWHEAGTLQADLFNSELTYFRGRYYDGDFTDHFYNLHLRRGDQPELVREVIARTDNDPCNRMIAILIIVYRFRNNLFHGIKWQYNIRGQLGNFTAANAILMTVLEQHGGFSGV